MKTFLVVLKDMDGVPDFLHPSELCGINKNEIQAMVTENTPPEYILGIFQPQEYINLVKTEKFKHLLIGYNPGLEQNRKALNHIIQSIINNTNMLIQENNPNSNIPLLTEVKQEDQTETSIPSALPKETSIFSDLPKEPAIPQQLQNENSFEQNNKKSEQPITNNIQVTKPIIKYFTDNGTQFKLENNQLYKKCWEDVNLEIITTESGETIYPEIRLVNKETGKPMKSTKILVQKLVWKKLN